MPLLSRDAILQAADLPRELVKVPEWGGEVYVRGLSGAERDQLEAAMLADKQANYDNFSARLAAMTMVDDRGDRLFSDSDVAALGCKSASALRRVAEVAQKLSAVSAADVEELTKNSASGQSDDSGSA